MTSRQPLRDVSDEDHRAAFGRWSYYGFNMNIFTQLRNNDPNLENFRLPADADTLTDSAWELLGRYLAHNSHVDQINFAYGCINDSKMVALCRGLAVTTSTVPRALDFSNNSFGVEGMRSAVPFLQSSNITKLYLGDNGHFDTECFELLVNALSGGSIQQLDLRRCDVKCIDALGSCNLPNLREIDLQYNIIKRIPALEEGCKLPNLRSIDLTNNEISQIPSLEKYIHLEILILNDNKVGEAGFRAVAKLLQKDESALEQLYLKYTGLGDNEAELLATSLRSNTKLRTLEIGAGNKFGERGLVSFSKVLNDISSIKRAVNSNHSLIRLGLSGLEHPSNNPKIYDLRRFIDEAIKINRGNRGRYRRAGREKVLETQLNSMNRKNLLRLQGVECNDHPFSDVDPLVLPNVLALVGEKSGWGDLYQTMIVTAPDIMSLVDRKALMESTVSKNRERLAVLAAEAATLNSVNSRLEWQLKLLSLESDRKNQTDDRNQLSRTKRELDGAMDR